MNIKFIEDFENSLMKVTVKLEKRVLAREEKIMVGWHKIKEIVDNQYTCPDTHVLGECLNPYQKMSNDYDHLLEKTWVFNMNRKLVEDASAPVPAETKSTPKRKKRKKKTVVKK